MSPVSLKSVYSSDDVRHLELDTLLGAPGSFPFTRGIRSEARGGWIQRGLSGEGDSRRSNQQLRDLIAMGQTGIDIIGDSPTMACLDPDHPLARHAVGTQGVSLCCLQDFGELFEGVALDGLSISSSLPAFFAICGLYLVAEKQGIRPDRLRGSVLQAPFYAEDCGYAMHLPFALRLRLTCDSIAFCASRMPRFHSFIEDTYFFSEVGLDVVEEMALGFVEIRHVVRTLLERGLDVDSFAPRIAVLVNCSMNFFAEIAKIRATRRLFATMMRDEFGARDPRSQAVVVTGHTSGLSLTAQQPANNIVRGAIQALALVLAGAQAIEISAFDEAYRTPSREAHLVGLRTQQVIDLETDVGSVLDPLGGSYLLESLTSDIEKQIAQQVADIESLGDPAALCEQGWFRDFFASAVRRYDRRLRENEISKVGVNVHRMQAGDDHLLKDIASTKLEPCHDRIERVRSHKSRRDSGAIRAVLQEVRQRAEDPNENLMEVMIEATRQGATLGEIAGMLRVAYGEAFDPHGLVDAPV